MFKFFHRIGRTKEDPEKAVLPCIIFISVNHPEYKEEINLSDFDVSGFGLSFGWWDWSIYIAFMWIKIKQINP